MKIWKYFLMILFLIFFIGCKTSHKVDISEKKDLIKEALKSGPIMPEPELTINWRMDNQVLTFSKDNLYEYIDGEAELFFPYGFKKLLVGNYVYRLNPNQTITIDIYEMGSQLDTFGIYSKYRYPYADFVNFGCEGFIEKDILRFYKDRYFISIRAIADAFSVNKNLSMAGRIIEELVPGNNALPSELNLIQSKNLISKSEMYDVEGFLGYGFLGKSLSAKYKYGDEEIRGFVVLRESEEEANNSLTQYKNYISQNTGGKELFSTLEGDIILVNDPNYGEIVIVQKQKYIFGSLGFHNRENGISLINEMLLNVK